MSTVTIVFTDVTGPSPPCRRKGRSEATARHGSAIEVLRAERGPARRARRWHLGDGVDGRLRHAVFRHAGWTTASVETERAASHDANPLHVRIGLNCGEASLLADDDRGCSARSAPSRPCVVCATSRPDRSSVTRWYGSSSVDEKTSSYRSSPSGSKAFLNSMVHEIHWEPLPETPASARVVVVDDAALLRAGITTCSRCRFRGGRRRRRLRHRDRSRGSEIDQPCSSPTSACCLPTPTRASQQPSTCEPAIPSSPFSLSQYMEPKGAPEDYHVGSRHGACHQRRPIPAGTSSWRCRTVLKEGLSSTRCSARRRSPVAGSRMFCVASRTANEKYWPAARGETNTAIADELLMSGKRWSRPMSAQSSRSWTSPRTPSVTGGAPPPHSSTPTTNEYPTGGGNHRAGLVEDAPDVSGAVRRRLRGRRGTREGSGRRILDCPRSACLWTSIR